MLEPQIPLDYKQAQQRLAESPFHLLFQKLARNESIEEKGLQIEEKDNVPCQS